MHIAHPYIFTLLCRMDEALYIHLHFYIFPSLFLYFWHAIPTLYFNLIIFLYT